MVEAYLVLSVDGAVVACRPGQNVLEALQSAGLVLASACQGQGKCGLCLVRVLSGAPSPATWVERRLLAAPDAPLAQRLACQMRLTACVDLALPDLGLVQTKESDL